MNFKESLEHINELLGKHKVYQATGAGWLEEMQDFLDARLKALEADKPENPIATATHFAIVDDGKVLGTFQDYEKADHYYEGYRKVLTSSDYYCDHIVAKDTGNIRAVFIYWKDPGTGESIEIAEGTVKPRACSIQTAPHYENGYIESQPAEGTRIFRLFEVNFPDDGDNPDKEIYIVESSGNRGEDLDRLYLHISESGRDFSEQDMSDGFVDGALKHLLSAAHLTYEDVYVLQMNREGDGYFQSAQFPVLTECK